jgi:hypothetical protein
MGIYGKEKKSWLWMLDPSVTDKPKRFSEGKYSIKLKE